MGSESEHLFCLCDQSGLLSSLFACEQDWTPSDISTASLFTPKEKETLATHLAGRSKLFTLISPDGDGGYPGTLKVEVFYALLSLKQPQRGVLAVYRARLEDGEETPVNLTQVKDSLLHQLLTVRAV